MEIRESMSSVSRVKTKIKVVLLGDQSTGKTSILLRFIHNRFEDGPCSTVGIDFLAKTMSFGNTSLRLQLWDTAGQQRFRSLIPSYLKDAAVTFIVFDLTSTKSFDNLDEWLDLCQSNRTEKGVVVVLGNKSDLVDERQVPKHTIENKIKKMVYFEVSAKSGVGIHQAFQYVGNLYLQGQEEEEKVVYNDRVIVSGNVLVEQKKKSRCCG